MLGSRMALSPAVVLSRSLCCASLCLSSVLATSCLSPEPAVPAPHAERSVATAPPTTDASVVATPVTPGSASPPPRRCLPVIECGCFEALDRGIEGACATVEARAEGTRVLDAQGIVQPTWRIDSVCPGGTRDPQPAPELKRCVEFVETLVACRQGCRVSAPPFSCASKDGLCVKGPAAL